MDALAAQLGTRRRARREAAVAALCALFEPLALAQARRYLNGGSIDVEELQQAARVGLVVACRTFDRKKGVFNTHALWCIRHELAECLALHDALVRLPTRRMRVLSQLHRAQARLGMALHREPTPEELATALRIPPRTVVDMLLYESGPMTDGVEQVAMTTTTPEDVILAREAALARRAYANLSGPGVSVRPLRSAKRDAERAEPLLRRS